VSISFISSIKRLFRLVVGTVGRQLVTLWSFLRNTDDEVSWSSELTFPALHDIQRDYSLDEDFFLKNDNKESLHEAVSAYFLESI
jgi:hypothetical protein